MNDEERGGPWLRGPGRALARALVCCLAGCAGQEPRPQQAPSLRASTSAAASPAASSPAAAPAASEPTPTLLVTEPALLAELEAQGLSLGAVLARTRAQTNAELARLPSFEPLLRELEREIGDVAATDKLAGVDVARFSHRLFDRRFLRRADASFSLAGVVNRPDRAPFGAGSCGETRLIYRLSYRVDAERASKLPMTLGVELPVPRPSEGCRAAAERWLEPAAANVSERAARLRSERGPLAPPLLDARAARVVVNLQIVRWPSTVRPDLGGHAEYLLRSFRFDTQGRLSPETLENTLDPAVVAAPPQRRALEAWIAENQAVVDAGTALVPAPYLARRALSVTPRGLSRLANRPFTSAKLRFDDVDFERTVLVKSASGLARRLDQLSCQGCHEARSVAGFHLLGEDAADVPNENALATAVSPHVQAELPRRLRIARDMLRGAEPDFSAPFAERPSPQGGYGAHCTLGADPTFMSWTCDEGLVCSATEAAAGEPIGQCLPTQRQVGDACETGGVAAHTDRRRDRMQSVKVEECPDMVCNRSAVGFPAGMCTARCGADGSSCGAIALLDSFNACLARGESFLGCIRGNASPSGLRPCSAESPCRDDYVCARAKAGGACIPPYFVFQLRVDGH